ncbi:MAG: pyridoxal phosphate-dependent aminotransferase [Actinomycetota bacterium]
MSQEIRISARAASFTESVIREMTRLAMEHDAINLAQGFPDFPAPAQVKEAARRAIAEDLNQYPITWGEQELREAIAAKYARVYGMSVDPERNLCVTCGSTEAMISSLLGVLDPGDEVVIFEPYYENYGPDTILADAVPRFVSLREPDWSFDEAELSAAFTNRTRGIVLNTPNNPTGKVFARGELEVIARLCQKWGAVAFTDEIYEHITYGDVRHVPLATIAGMEDRTVTVSALSKTYAVTGWRVGWVIAPAKLADGIRTVHDFLTVGAPTPLQHAGIVALGLPDAYYETISREYAERRALMLDILAEAGFGFTPPQGAYYVMADISHLGFANDVEAARHMAEDVGVAVVPGSSFYSRPELGRNVVRFAFCKHLATLREAGERLRARLGPRDRSVPE